MNIIRIFEYKSKIIHYSNKKNMTNRGGSAGRVDATRGSKHHGLEHAREKRKHARFVATAGRY
jgi:hypothetical protein